MLYLKIGNQMTLKSSPSGIFITAPVIRSTGVHLGLAFLLPIPLSIPAIQSMLTIFDSGDMHVI